MKYAVAISGRDASFALTLSGNEKFDLAGIGAFLIACLLFRGQNRRSSGEVAAGLLMQAGSKEFLPFGMNATLAPSFLAASNGAEYGFFIDQNTGVIKVYYHGTVTEPIFTGGLHSFARWVRIEADNLRVKNELVGRTVCFRYASGTEPGSFRTVVVDKVEEKNGRQYLCGVDVRRHLEGQKSGEKGYRRFDMEAVDKLAVLPTPAVQLS